MNCIDVCRQIATEPNRLDEAVLSHLKSCAACAAYAKNQKTFEQALEGAIAVDVPDGLKDRILLNQNQHRRHKPTPALTRWTAIVASLLAGFGLVWLVGINNNLTTIEKNVLTHIQNELDHLTENKPMTLSKLNQMSRPLKLSFKQHLPNLRYAGTCKIHRHTGVHLVLKGKHGPVTVLLMPNEFIPKKTMINSRRFRGQIVPTVFGSIAIIGEHNENVESIKQQVQAVIQSSSS